MPYRFTCDYSSSVGTWAAGEVAELDDDTAAWLLRDVAGCIVVVGPQDDAGAPEDESRSLDTPSHDRQLKRAPRKR